MLIEVHVAEAVGQRFVCARAERCIASARVVTGVHPGRPRPQAVGLSIDGAHVIPFLRQSGAPRQRLGEDFSLCFGFPKISATES